MPVDLSSIPDVARRKPRPSLKRWFVVLLILVVCGGFLTSWLWPAHKAAKGSLFWHCFVTAPLVIWLLLLGARWLWYLVSEWLAEGWDNEREQDIANEILRGQRFLVLDGMCVHLPHAVTSGVLTHQFTLPKGVILPATVDEETQTVSYKASFADKGQAMPERIRSRLVSLLQDASLQSTLPERSALTVIVQADAEASLSEDEYKAIQQALSPLLPVSSRIQFSPAFGFEDIDRWLDEPEAIDTLLLLSVNLRSALTDGQGEAAVAVLLRIAHRNDEDNLAVTRIHRPERTKDTGALNTSVMQALQWGDTCVGDIAWLWLAGLGTENKAQTLLASNNLRFPRVNTEAQVTDIDMKSGHTGMSSPWLAIVLAAGNTGQSPNPQLIMSMPENEDLPWWLVVYPASAS